MALTILTIIVLHLTAASGSSNHILSTILAGCLGFTALSILLRQHLLAFAKRHFKEQRTETVTALTVFAGALLGVLASLTSVGAGAIGMTALVMLYPRHPIVGLVGSDIAHAVPLRF
jgi:hypothetical protein